MRLNPRKESNEISFFHGKKRTLAREIAGDRGNVVLVAGQTSHGGLFSYGFRGGGREKERERKKETAERGRERRAKQMERLSFP